MPSARQERPFKPCKGRSGPPVPGQGLEPVQAIVGDVNIVSEYVSDLHSALWAGSAATGSDNLTGARSQGVYRRPQASCLDACIA